MNWVAIIALLQVQILRAVTVKEGHGARAVEIEASGITSDAAATTVAEEVEKVTVHMRKRRKAVETASIDSMGRAVADAMNWTQLLQTDEYKIVSHMMETDEFTPLSPSGMLLRDITKFLRVDGGKPKLIHHVSLMVYIIIVAAFAGVYKKTVVDALEMEHVSHGADSDFQPGLLDCLFDGQLCLHSSFSTAIRFAHTSQVAGSLGFWPACLLFQTLGTFGCCACIIAWQRRDLREQMGYDQQPSTDWCLACFCAPCVVGQHALVVDKWTKVGPSVSVGADSVEEAGQLKAGDDVADASHGKVIKDETEGNAIIGSDHADSDSERLESDTD